MKNIKNIIEQKNPPEDPNVLWLKDDTLYKSTSKGWVPLNESPSITEHYEDHKSTLTYTGSDGKEHAVITDDSFTPNNDGDIVITDSNNEEHTIVTEENLNEILSNGTVVPITWQELKDKRDNGELIPGSLYRITDYNCTTTQENTQSAGHQFDIVLLALSENKLAEEGWAMMNESNIYDVTFADGVTLKCYWYQEPQQVGDGESNLVVCSTMLGSRSYATNIDMEGEAELNVDTINKTATCISASTDLDGENITYNYFQNSNLSAWKVWYCLDNDTARFAWADDASEMSITIENDDLWDDDTYVRNPSEDVNDLYAWTGQEMTIYSRNLTPKVGDSTSTLCDAEGNPASGGTITVVAGFGRGVIYRLIDEFNNDIKYDFKNIQFKRKLTNGQYDENGTETWCYTLNLWYNDMCQDASIVGNTLTDDEYKISGVRSNSFGCTIFDYPIEEPNTITFALNDNVILSIIEDSYYYGIYDNNFGEFFNNNTIGSGCDSNIIGNHSNGNIIRNGFRNNSIGNYFIGNSIGDGFEGNVIGGSFNSNNINGAFMGNFVANSFEDITISSDTRGKNYGNHGVELATKDDIGDIETALNNI